MARRITPIAVDQPVAPAHALGVELPLDVGPAPDQGDIKAVHPTLGAGRRVWVDIQGSWQLKFKHVSAAASVELTASSTRAQRPPAQLPKLWLLYLSTGAQAAGSGLQHMEA